jgi:hypothetical protein
MTKQKNWTLILGEPQGNESVWASNIIRKVDCFKHKILHTFDNNVQANNAFYQWLKENNNGENYDSSRIA